MSGETEGLDSRRRQASTAADKTPVNNTPTAARKTTYQCPKCRQFYVDELCLAKHLASHEANRQAHKCKVCGAVFPRKNEFTQHLRTHKEKKPFPCAACDKSFSHRSTLLQHYRTHASEMEAMEASSSSDDSDSHQEDGGGRLAEDDDTETYPCDECEEIFIDAASLGQHARMHSETEGAHKCDSCAKRFHRQDELDEHYCESMHRNNVTTPAAAAIAYKCDICEGIFAEKSTLILHLESHVENPPSTQKTTPPIETSAPLDNRLAVVDDVVASSDASSKKGKTYQCDKCKQFYVDEESLQRHRRSHPSLRFYKCAECGGMFTQKNYLTSHLKKHKK